MRLCGIGEMDGLTFSVCWTPTGYMAIAHILDFGAYVIDL